MSRCTGCASGLHSWALNPSINFTSMTGIANPISATMAVPTSYNEIPTWLEITPGRTEAWSVEAVTDTTFRLHADSGRYMQAVAATSTDFINSAALAMYNASYLNADAIMPVIGTLWSIVPYQYNANQFYLQSELGCVIGRTGGQFLPPDQLLTQVAFCATLLSLEGAFWTTIISATKAPADINYMTPMLALGVLAPYAPGSTVQILSEDSSASLQWSNVTTPGAVNRSLSFGPITNDYRDSFQVTIVGDPSTGVITLTTLDNWSMYDVNYGLYAASPTSGVNATEFNVWTCSEMSGWLFSVWSSAEYPDRYTTNFRTVSPADVTSYKAAMPSAT